MDMRFYPPPVQPPLATDLSCSEPSRRFDPLYYNKFDRGSMYMSMSELIQDFTPASQVFPVSGFADEDFNIPPITPPALPELTLPPPPESEPGAYHSQHPPLAQSKRNVLQPFLSHRMDPPGITISNMLCQDGGPPPSFLSAMLHKANSPYAQTEDFRPSIQSVMVQHGQLTTINQSQLSTHLGLSGNKALHSSPSPLLGTKRASPSPSSSVHEEDLDEPQKGCGADKRPAEDMGKKPKVQKKKKKKDPNEPQKPVSAYALFFRDTQAAIKGQNPSATFGEVSKIVASTWDRLGEEQKQLYKKKTEAAKTEYLKQLAAYRANLVSQSYSESDDVIVPQGSKLPLFPRSDQANGGVYSGLPHCQQLHPSAPTSGMPLPGANMASQIALPGADMAGSSPPPHPIMQRCASLQHQQHFVPMQKPLGNHQPLGSHQHHQIPFHPQSIQQGFPPQAEFHGMLHGMSTVGLPLTLPTGNIQSECRDSSSHGLDWSVEYCSNGTLQR